MSKYAAVLFVLLMAGSQCGSLAGDPESQSEVLGTQSPWDTLSTLLEKLPTKKVEPPRFELIGSRYFYIEQNVKQNWTTAASSCRQMGGYLAAIKDEEEAQAIIAKLTPWDYYYMGINDHEKKRSFVSLASGKPAYLKWSEDEPDYVFHDQNCVAIFNYEKQDEGLMLTPCSNKKHFICQADNEI
nr:accessory gland protein Acp29AB-like [Drosophila takahashii]